MENYFSKLYDDGSGAQRGELGLAAGASGVRAASQWPLSSRSIFRALLKWVSILTLYNLATGSIKSNYFLPVYVDLVSQYVMF